MPNVNWAVKQGDHEKIRQPAVGSQLTFPEKYTAAHLERESAANAHPKPVGFFLYRIVTEY